MDDPAQPVTHQPDCADGSPAFCPVIDVVPFPLVLIARNDDTIVFINRKAAELFALAQNDVTGRPSDVLLDADIRTTLLDEIAQFGATNAHEWRLRRPSGQEFWALVTGSVTELQGRPVLLVGLHNITQRKNAEDEMTRLKEFNEGILQHMAEGVVVEDINGNFVFVNPAMCQMLGQSPEALLGTHWTKTIAPEFYAAVHEANQRRAAGQSDRYELELIHRDGSGVPILISGRPLYDTVTGGFSGSLAVFTNISESKRIQEELRRAKEAAEAANRAKSTFLANMSHELRTPLNAILGFSELMQDDPGLSDVQRTNLGIINRSGEHLLRLINDVLDMAKIEAGRTVLQPQNFDLHVLFRDLEDMFTLRAADRGIALIFDYLPDLPRCIRADERKLRQVLINLLSNAVKFTDTGQVLLHVDATQTGDTWTLHFEVRDTGAGIDTQELGTIFEPFRQAFQPDKIQEGTGLGLSISRQFVRLMGGELRASSAGAGGYGSVFQFDIPVELAPVSIAHEAEPRRTRAIGLEPGQPDYRLLVVEDNEANRRLMVQFLTRLGLETRAAANGLECLQIWEEWQPHLIWMDRRMPVMDGHEATRRIKSTSQGQATAVIALTASVFEEDLSIVLAEGCDDFVRKPFREQDIIAKLTKYLGIRFVYAPQESGRDEGTTADNYPRTGHTHVLDLSGLPSAWRTAFEQAAIAADADELTTLAGQIRKERPASADAIESLVRAFDYDALLAALDNTSSEG